MKRNSEEKKIERSILDYLWMLPNCFFWKNNSVGVWDPVKKIYRKPNSPYVITGVSDILGIYHGKLVAIEVKTPKTRKRVSESQKFFLDKVNKLDGTGFVATSIDEVRDKLNEM